MKRIKMMLLSLALFAVVGGALAFKAKFTNTFCTGASIQGACANVACGTKVNASKIDPNGTTGLVCTTTYDNNNCAQGLLCTTETPTSITKDGH